MMRLEGSCRCGAVAFSCDSHTPVPYQLCYCTICRKTAGGGGFAINLGADARTLRVAGETKIFHAEIVEGDIHTISTGERHFCPVCGTHLWLYDPTWPTLVHPLASVIDTPLPRAPVRTHLMLGDKPDWVPLEAGPDDLVFDGHPDESIEAWHIRHGLRID
jgi:hypothetical protein